MHSFATEQGHADWSWCAQCGFSGDLLRVYAKHTRQSRQISAKQLAAKTGTLLGKQEQEQLRSPFVFQRRVYRQRITRIDVLTDLAARWGWCRYSQFFTAINQDGLLAAGYARQLPFSIKGHVPLLPVKHAPGLISGYLIAQEKSKSSGARLHPLLLQNTGGLVLADRHWLEADLIVIGDALKSVRCQSLLDSKIKARTPIGFAGLYESFPGAAATAVKNISGQIIIAHADLHYELLATAIKLDLPVVFDIDCEDWLLKNKAPLLQTRLQKTSTPWEHWLSRYIQDASIREIVLLVKALTDLGLPLATWVRRLGSSAARRVTQNVETAALCPIRNFRRSQIAKAENGYWLVDRDGNLCEKITDFTFDILNMEIGTTYKTNSYDLRVNHEKQSFNIKANQDVERRPFDVIRDTMARLTGKLLTCDRRWRQLLFDVSLLFEKPKVSQNQSQLGFDIKTRICRFGAFGINAVGDRVAINESPTIFDALEYDFGSTSITTPLNRQRLLLAAFVPLLSLMLDRLQIPLPPILLTGKAARLYASDFYKQLLLNDSRQQLPNRFRFFVQDAEQTANKQVVSGAYVVDTFRRQLATFLCEPSLWVDAALFPTASEQNTAGARWLLVDAYQRSCHVISHFETCRSVTDVLTVYRSQLYEWYGHSYDRKTLNKILHRFREPVPETTAAGFIAYVMLARLAEVTPNSLIVCKLKARDHIKKLVNRQLPLCQISAALEKSGFLLKDTPGGWHIKPPAPGVVRTCNRYHLT